MATLPRSFPTRLLPAAPGLRFQLAALDAQILTVHLATSAPIAHCPRCMQPARRIHSRYVRTPADLPWAGVTVRLHLTVRKFFCRNPVCSQRIFVERLSAVVAPHARVTVRFHVVLRFVAFALGGEAGARLCNRLGLPSSPDRLLSIIRRTPLDAPAPAATIGLDDWAVRKGARYGSIVVDLDTHRVIDLLPDRDAATVEAWLKAHVTVATIARDRFDSYAVACRHGAPQAVQVVDRWHLMKNVGDALERVVTRHPDVLRRVAAQLAPAPTVAVPAAPAARHVLVPATRRRRTTPAQAARRRRYARVHTLHANGLSITAISAELGLSRPTVRTYLRATSVPEHGACPRHLTAQSPAEAYWRQRWAAGCDNAAELWRELQALGFRGSAGTVRRYVGAWRTTPRRPGRAVRTERPSRPPPPRPPSVRRVRWWLVGSADNLDADAVRFVERLRVECPTLATAAALAQDFNRIIRERDSTGLEPWLERTAASGIAELAAVAASMRGDQREILAALRLPWSTGPVEGHIHRLKLLKRSAYGRAKFDLLRQRVLYHD